MYRKISLQGSEHKDRKRLAPEQRQGVKRSIPPSISSRTYKFKRPNTSSQGVESIAGPSRLPDCRLNKSTTVESQTEGSGRDNKTRQTRATTRGRNKQAERPVLSNQATARRPCSGHTTCCPYYLRSRVKESDGIPEEQRNIEINGIPHSRIRRRSLSMEALDGDPAGQVDRSECAVRNCWEQWTREGTHVRKTGSGATSKTTKREDRRIVRQALLDPTVTRSTIRADVGVALVPQTISRHLAEANLKSKHPFRALPLTPEHRQLRLQWCQARSMWNVTDWQKVVFSDESRFVLGTDDNRVQVWRRPARVAQVFQRHFQTLPWPARSPDLSPVEHVWDQLKRKMSSCHSVHDLELAVQNLWAHLSQDNISCQVIYSQFGLAIHQNDHQGRRIFVEWAQIEIAIVPDFHKRILFSDEAHFWLKGYVNKQNCRIWSEANTQVYVETPLHPEKLTVWCALWAGGIIGPYFFKNDEGHNVAVNGDQYRAMITNFFIPEMNNHDVQELWFQQDGATCHTARATIDLLKDTFGDRLISRFGPVNWPPRSCDLTPLDYFLWGYVNSLVYADKPQSLDHLEDNIRRVIADIRPQMLEKVVENWTSRLDYIRASHGSHMPEIIFKM
ncbi:HTH_Tnp_Tc3_2 domain-containing protein [Trichonephila clavipes]|nr:HTH_Tnp_Tc3_2 domain-containing protein [Trichonephila clavipes]